jgi:hypothetical protein
MLHNILEFKAKERAGDFMATFSGRKFWPLDPRADEVDIKDIAHSLALQCRYAGHSVSFYSVAEHSVLMARWLRTHYGPLTALAGLLHDASEAYLVDVPRPVKPFLTGYKAIEAKVQTVVYQKYGLPPEMPAAVHEADNRIIADELKLLVPMDWHGKHDDPLGVPVAGWSWQVAEQEFLTEFESLVRKLGRVA